MQTRRLGSTPLPELINLSCQWLLYLPVYPVHTTVPTARYWDAWLLILPWHCYRASLRAGTVFFVSLGSKCTAHSWCSLKQVELGWHFKGFRGDLTSLGVWFGKEIKSLFKVHLSDSLGDLAVYFRIQKSKVFHLADQVFHNLMLPSSVEPPPSSQIWGLFPPVRKAGRCWQVPRVLAKGHVLLWALPSWVTTCLLPLVFKGWGNLSWA